MNINWGLVGSLVGLLAICVAYYIFSRSQRTKRVEHFENSFFRIYKGDGCIIECLIPAGIVNLNDDKEIELALRKLKNRPNMVQHPLRQWNNDIRKIGYKEFFQKIANGPGQLNKGTIEVYITSWKKQ